MMYGKKSQIAWKMRPPISGMLGSMDNQQLDHLGVAVFGSQRQ